jgi:RecA-family ATPase
VLFGALGEIARRTGAAIILSHHAGKAAGAAGAGAARGAPALADGARIVRQLIPMTDKKAGFVAGGALLHKSREGFIS